MGVKVIQHYGNALRVRVANIDQFLDVVRLLYRRPLLGDVHIALIRQRFKEQEQAQALYRPDIDLQGLHDRRIGPGWTVLAFIRFSQDL